MLLAATLVIAAAGSTMPVLADNDLWETDSKGTRYNIGDGSYATKQWLKVDGVWYYFNAEGYRQTGWKKLGEKWYHFTEDGRAQYGWQTIDGKKYYFDANGVMATGEKEIDGKTYNFGSNGVLTEESGTKEEQKEEKKEEKKEEQKSSDSYTVGKDITFGSYEQDNNLANGKEPIQWRVLAVEGDKALLIALCGLDVQKYNQKWKKLTYADSTIRTWLNQDFMKEAFTAEQQQKILSTKLSDVKNAKYGTDWGKSTTDKIFLLSRKEAEKYFATNDSRKCWPTEYAKARGAYMSSANATYGIGWWFLRSPGGNAAHAAGITTTGKVDVFGNHVNFESALIRPAMWIKVN